MGRFYEIFRLDCYSVPVMQPKLKRNLLFRFPPLFTRSFFFSAQSNALNRIDLLSPQNLWGNWTSSYPNPGNKAFSLACLCVFLCSSLLKERNCSTQFCYSYFYIQNIIHFLVSLSCVWSGFSTATKVKAVFFTTSTTVSFDIYSSPSSFRPQLAFTASRE